MSTREGPASRFESPSPRRWRVESVAGGLKTAVVRNRPTCRSTTHSNKPTVVRFSPVAIGSSLPKPVTGSPQRADNGARETRTDGGRGATKGVPVVTPFARKAHCRRAPRFSSHGSEGFLGCRATGRKCKRYLHGNVRNDQSDMPAKVCEGIMTLSLKHVARRAHECLLLFGSSKGLYALHSQYKIIDESATFKEAFVLEEQSGKEADCAEAVKNFNGALPLFRLLPPKCTAEEELYQNAKAHSFVHLYNPQDHLAIDGGCFNFNCTETTKETTSSTNNSTGNIQKKQFCKNIPKMTKQLFCVTAPQPQVENEYPYEQVQHSGGNAVIVSEKL
ncbi:hypothetical protein Efla_004274 [Eimeria flavescens]